ncbi:MAG: ABC transporter ATP-binding protein [Clostridia bacterium]|nr:ABC transporter ATP-binding protein [Clostridia bacterium]
MKTLLHYLKPQRALVALAVTLKFIASIADLLIPLVLTHLIDNIVPTKRVSLVVLWGGVMVLCALTALSFNVLSNRTSAVAAGRTTRALRHDLFEKTLHLSAAQTDECSLPTLISRLTSDTYHINRFIAQIQRIGIRAPILLIGGIIITAMLDPMMALVFVVLMPFIALVTALVSRRGIKLYREQQECLDDMTRVIQENVTGVRVIRALSKTDDEIGRFARVTGSLSRKSREAGITMGITGPTNTLILNIGLSAVILVGAYRLNSGAVQPGVLLAFLNYFTMILTAMMAVTRVFIMSSRGMASAKRVADVLAYGDALPLLPPQEKKEDAPYLEFRHVSFSYHKKKPDLDRISFTLQKGQTLGIIGGTGSGKTTLIQLLCRFYDADEGEILLEGRDIRSIPLHELRARFGVVFQNDFVPALTIAENVNFFRDLTQEQRESAARSAQAAEFINEKAEGWNEPLSIRGANLSGGQRQRLLISRALAGDPDILILDDSSSALDYRTDMCLRRALRERYGESTTVTVAQRISSVCHADLILVLDKGKTIGIGRHEELLESCEEYRLIYETQMGGGSFDEEGAN